MATVLDELGYSGLANFSGRIQEDFLREFRGREAYKRYNEMRLNSPAIGALLLAIESAVRSISWYYKSEAGPDDERVAFLDYAETFLSHSWNDFISECLTFVPFGFAPFAIWYERDDRGRIVWRKFLLLGQNTVYKWDMADDGGIKGMWQQGLPSYKLEYVPVERMVIYRSRVERNNPEGRSVLRNAWIPYYFGKHTMQYEGIGLERDLAGMPTIILPATADTRDGSTDMTQAQKIVRNIRRDEQEGIVVPFGWDLKLLSTGGSRQFDTDKVINRYDSRMLMAALHQFLLLGQDGAGSLALSVDQSNFATMIVNGIADIICETHSQFAVKRLLALNGMDTEGVTLEHMPAGDMSASLLGTVLEQVGDKLTWTLDDESWLRKVLRMPEKTPEELQAIKDKKAEGERQQAESAMIPETPPEQTGAPLNGKEPSLAAEGLPPRMGLAKMLAEFQGALTDFRAARNGEREHS